MQIRKWVKNNVGKVEDKITSLEGMILGLDMEEEQRSLEDNEIKERLKAMLELRKAFKSEEKLWSTKARTQWQKGGDQCSKFFRSLVNSSVSNKNIESLSVDGTMISERGAVQEYMKSFYSNLYCEEEQLEFRKLKTEDATGMEKPFLEQEIWEAMCDLVGEKSPGPDGFPIRFYKSCWRFMKKDMMPIFDDFYNNGFLDWRLNTTHISLIPKVPGACSLMDYRPISLLSGCYKILAKVLANRLKPHLQALVSEFQGAAVVGR